ncbi:anhydro-N-acetylmuramic acid kinase [Propionimicrobium sp. PCR01-08-3]|uniref:anhydro-N-acetylmuramic acid kinase n=1 Tax=Propionimicrobium sp. PCR01-08-3 TaxID=3052086 RepID=UPI00255CA1EE|nr:anhydro-N-acetylmuramic acid kinase [Propionimicrobium sp. PCR01-08-3]WIY82446.1 anhydro-N-acetylmuramic acid kinase [Propionimicrobium sp. PCR01-08-3]
MRVLGMISGTSHDGIDAAVVDFSEQDGLLTARIVTDASVPYDNRLRSRLIAALPPAETTLDEICELDTLIGQAFAKVAVKVANAAGGIDAVCSHGQTVYHWVKNNRALGTLQIGQPAWIAEATGRPVVSDIRARDLTVGGQGAPLASTIDHLLLAGRGETAGALNMGGISNLTVVAPDSLSAFDIGPANALIDAIVTTYGLNPLGYDADATIARQGRIDQELLGKLLDDPYYSLPNPKSTGKEYFNIEYVDEAISGLGHRVPAYDLIASLTELTVCTIADAVRAAGISYLACSGGGIHNPLIMEGLRRELPGVEVVLSDALGVPADSKEAVLMALLGWCTLHGVPGIVPGGTGSAEPRILGSITPGTGPLVLPEPVDTITGLRIEDQNR